MRDLLIMTTVGRDDLVNRALSSLRDPLDVLLIEGGSNRELNLDFKIEGKFKLIREDEPKGLIAGQNLGYHYFLDNNYDRCIYSNDDVIYPEGFSKSLLDGTLKFDLMGALTNGVKGADRVQHIDRFLDCEDYRDVDWIQMQLESNYSNHPYMSTNRVNGFALAWSRDRIEKFEYNDDRDLFNPNLLHLHGEVDLYRKILSEGGKCAIALTSYIFHDKGQTLHTHYQRTHLWTEFDQKPWET